MATRTRRVTASDVGRHAGVSQSTVSYVLNNTPGQTISEVTRRRVLDAVEELGYAPSAAARTLANGTSNTVLIVLPDQPIGPHIAQFIEDVADELEPHGYSVLYRRHRDEATFKRAWQEISPAAIANMVAFGDDQGADISAAGIPQVRCYLDAHGPSDLTMPQVAAGRVQAAHLLERGHKRIGYAAPTEPRVAGCYTRRLDGVREVLAAARLPEPVVIPVPMDSAGAAAALTPHVEGGSGERVTGICAFSDEEAFAVLAGMRVLGLSAPADLAVVGVENQPLSPFAAPPLTTVDLSIVDVAANLSKALLAVIDGESDVDLPPPPVRLIRRESA
ncbi:MAG: LacI family DNA-binding transcriptional regulator [Propionibacteriaceae bacterium]|nr:LacI family DNA-binding transcriptional regulator [Propionibacteriaceae bacterium]